MFKALMRVRMASIKTWFAGASRSKKKISKGKAIGFAALMIYAFGCVGFMFYNYFSALAAPLYAQGLGWLYFAMFAMAAFALVFIGSVFTTKAQLFEAKDNDLLLSLPIPPGKILLSRLSLLWIVSTFFDILVAVPAALAWFTVCPDGGASVFAFVVVSLLLPFLGLAVSSLFGWLLSLVAQRVRRKSLVSTVLSLAFLGAYFWFISQVNTLITQLAAAGERLAEALGGVAPLYWLGAAVSEGNMLYLLYTALCLLLPFVLACWLLSRSFIKTITAHRGAAKIEYRETRQAAVSPFRALLRREAKRFFSCSAYVLNGGLGVVFLAAGGVALVILGPQLRAAVAQMGSFGDFLAPLLVVGICMMNGMTLIAAAGISIEGHNLWILQSLPVESRDVLRVKLLMHLSLAMPATLIAGVGAAIAVRASLLQTLALLLVPQAFAVLMALADLMANLRHPMLDWTNETQAVKSGVSVLIGMALAWGGAILMAGVYVVLCLLLTLPEALCYLLMLAVLAALCAVVYRWLMGRGVRRFEEL